MKKNNWSDRTEAMQDSINNKQEIIDSMIHQRSDIKIKLGEILHVIARLNDGMKMGSDAAWTISKHILDLLSEL